MKNIFNSAVTLTGIQNQVGNDFAKTLGLEFTEIGPNFLKGILKVDSRHLRPGNIMNGGVSLALIETVGSVAARCVIFNEPKNSLGIQVNANHLQIARPGDHLTIIATAVHIGKTTHIWDVNITNQQDRLVSSGRITMLIVEQ